VTPGATASSSADLPKSSDESEEEEEEEEDEVRDISAVDLSLIILIQGYITC